MFDFLFAEAPPADWLIQLFLFNGLISVSVTLLLINGLKLATVKRKWAFAWLLIGIGAFIPLIGILLIILLSVLLRIYGIDFRPIEINVFSQVVYARRKPIKTAALGTNWANVRLQSSTFTKSERVGALHGISRGLSRDSNLIYANLVSDDLEELRICAFSLLEKQQDFLQSHINILLKKHQKEHQSSYKAFLAKQIALLYWELVYQNLAAQEFRLLLLERSHFFAKEALNLLTDDASLLVLLAKISIEYKKMDEAMHYLTKALARNAPGCKIIPYLAEIAYQRKDYQYLRDCLRKDFSLRYIFKVNGVVNFWCPS